MGTSHGKNGVVKVSTVTVAEVDRWTVRETVPTEDDTAQGDAAQTHLVGIPGWNGSLTCHYDPADTTGQGALTIGAQVTLNLYPQGAGASAVYKTGTATITEIGIEVPKNGVISREFSFQGQGALAQATVAGP